MFGGGNDRFNQPEAKPTKPIPFIGPQQGKIIEEIRIVGNKAVTEQAIRTIIGSKKGRLYDPIQVRRDKRNLLQTSSFKDVKPLVQPAGDKVILTFQILENPLVGYIRFVGNQKIKDKKLLEQAAIAVGSPLSRYSVDEGRRRLEQFYELKGFSEATVRVAEGNGKNDRGVVYEINEGKVVRIRRTTFTGNQIASGARLKTLVESKPGLMWLMGGKANKDEVEQDRHRITAYYRSLGYFKAEVTRQLKYNDAGTWVSINFDIKEGPRYRINDVQLEGAEDVHPGQLVPQLTLRKGDYYDFAQLQADINMLRDEYGSRGFIAADIKAEPRFHEQPGKIDLVYKVSEGQRYRVGRILVNIDGGQGQTKRTVVLNRLSIRPGDVVDIREIRKSERRLQSSNLFQHEPARGVTPQIVVKPRPSDTQLAAPQRSSHGSTYRGQSPRHETRRPVPPLADVYVNVASKGGSE